MTTRKASARAARRRTTFRRTTKPNDPRNRLIALLAVFVIIGAADVDFDGVGEGLDGALDAAADGAAEGMIEGAAEGAAEAGAEGLTASATEGLSFIGFLSMLGLRKAPITVVFSIFSLFSWLFCYLGVHFLSAVAEPLVPIWLFGAAIAGAAAVT